MGNKPVWNNIGEFELTIQKSQVGINMWAYFYVRSPREFHASEEPGFGMIDDSVTFSYEVLPPRSKC